MIIIAERRPRGRCEGPRQAQRETTRKFGARRGCPVLGARELVATGASGVRGSGRCVGFDDGDCRVGWLAVEGGGWRGEKRRKEEMGGNVWEKLAEAMQSLSPPERD